MMKYDKIEEASGSMQAHEMFDRLLFVTIRPWWYEMKLYFYRFTHTSRIDKNRIDDGSQHKALQIVPTRSCYSSFYQGIDNWFIIIYYYDIVIISVSDSASPIHRQLVSLMGCNVTRQFNIGVFINRLLCLCNFWILCDKYFSRHGLSDISKDVLAIHFVFVT